VRHLTVAVTGTDAQGRSATGTATARVLDRAPCSGMAEAVEAEVERMLAFAELVEHHARALRRDLERFRHEPRFEWFRRDERERD
jgi:hypothetical protein